MRFLYHPKIEADQEVCLSEEEFRHAAKSLRLQVADKVELVNGAGESTIAEVIAIDKRNCLLRTTDVIEHSRAYKREVSILVSPLKNDSRFEWMVEKLAELGVAKIIPIICENSEKKHIKADRLQRIVVSALKQSQQYWLPNILEPTSFLDAIANVATKAQKFIPTCYLDMERIKLSSVDLTEKVSIAIGPEGDFSIPEIELAVAQGWQLADLGPTRLRAETAATAAAIQALI